MLVHTIWMLIALNVATYGRNAGLLWLELIGCAIAGATTIDCTIEWRKWLKEQRKKEEEGTDRQD